VSTGDGLEGNVIVFTGGGKGKTTAAVGLACRALGHGGKAAFIYFTGPLRPSLGEVRSIKLLGPRVTMIAIRSQAAQKSYVDQFDESVPTVDAALDRASDLLRDPDCRLLVLDDINPLLADGALGYKQVWALIQRKPDPTTIVFTGRLAPDWLVEMANIVTDFAEVKHPVHEGVGPRRGIEF
jgi:cob(I)alamin adenosyltransferase